MKARAEPKCCNIGPSLVGHGFDTACVAVEKLFALKAAFCCFIEGPWACYLHAFKMLIMCPTGQENLELSVVAWMLSIMSLEASEEGNWM